MGMYGTGLLIMIKAKGQRKALKAKVCSISSLDANIEGSSKKGTREKV